MTKKQSLVIHDSEALKKMLEEKMTQLASLRFQDASKALRQVRKIRLVKKEIARIKTALHTLKK